jgi:hypothetical protein
MEIPLRHNVFSATPQRPLEIVGGCLVGEGFGLTMLLPFLFDGI